MIFEKYIQDENYSLFFQIEVEESEVKDIVIYDLIDRIFDSKKFGDNVNKVVYYIRTIFRDYTEKYLRVEVSTQKQGHNTIVMTNQKVTKYEINKSLEVNVGNQVSFKFEYTDLTGIRISLNNSNNLINDLSLGKINVNNIFDYEIETIRRLNNIKSTPGLYLGKDEKILIDIYKLFYNEYPDFSRIEDIYKTQSMMWLLYKEGIQLSDESGFSIRHSGKPWSDNIQNIIEHLIPFGKIYNYSGNKVKLNGETYKIIELMGKIIKAYGEFYEDKNLLLENISSISYIIDRCIATNSKIEDIISTGYVKCNAEEIKEIYEFLQRMSTALTAEEPIKKYKELLLENQNIENSNMETNVRVPIYKPVDNKKKEN